MALGKRGNRFRGMFMKRFTLTFAAEFLPVDLLGCAASPAKRSGLSRLVAKKEAFAPPAVASA